MRGDAFHSDGPHPDEIVGVGVQEHGVDPSVTVRRGVEGRALQASIGLDGPRADPLARRKAPGAEAENDIFDGTEQIEFHVLAGANGLYAKR